MTIKNIVINGGGSTIFNIYGALRESNIKGLWKHDEIERYFGTSAGAIMSLMVVLNYPWEDMDSFMIDRPWNTVFKFNIINIFEYYSNNGILGLEYVYDIFRPLFKGKDIDINITFLEFYSRFGKELYFYATDLNSFDVVELSHETCPDMKSIFDALGFELDFDEAGNLVGLGYWDKSGNEDYFLSCFAGYVKDGSYIQWKGEESEDYYRYLFKDGKMIAQRATMVLTYSDEDSETYEFGKPTASDLAMIEWSRKRQEESEKAKALAASENN